MALLKLGPMVADIRGSVGGVTFARNRGGAYARNRTAPLNPQSPRQVAVRTILAQLATAWTITLTQAQRDAWELYADNVPLPNSLGELRKVSGLAMYVRTNSLIIDTGGLRLDAAPTIFTLGNTVTPTVTISAGTDTGSVTALAGVDLLTEDVRLLFQQGTPQNQGVGFFKSPFRRWNAGLFDAVADLPFPLGAAPHPMATGQAIFFRTACVTIDGRVGVPTVVRFLAGA